MSSRDSIFADLRKSLGRTEALDATRIAELETRDDVSTEDERPQVAGDLIERFVVKLTAGAGTVTRVQSLGDVPKAVTQYLDEHGLDANIVSSDNGIVSDIEWPEDFDVQRRRANKDDRVSVTGALAAVAETGTVVIPSDPQSPTTLNFLPDNHIAVIPTGALETHLEDVWQTLRDADAMPRAVNFISGPSKTADVEQTLQLGAHGPRRLHVIMVG